MISGNLGNRLSSELSGSYLECLKLRKCKLLLKLFCTIWFSIIYFNLNYIILFLSYFIRKKVLFSVKMEKRRRKLGNKNVASIVMRRPLVNLQTIFAALLNLAESWGQEFNKNKRLPSCSRKILNIFLNVY